MVVYSKAHELRKLNFIEYTLSAVGRGKAGRSLPPYVPLMGPYTLFPRINAYLLPPRSKYHTSPAPLSYKRPPPPTLYFVKY